MSIYHAWVLGCVCALHTKGLLLTRSGYMPSPTLSSPKKLYICIILILNLELKSFCYSKPKSRIQSSTLRYGFSYYEYLGAKSNFFFFLDSSLKSSTITYRSLRDDFRSTSRLYCMPYFQFHSCHFCQAVLGSSSHSTFFSEENLLLIFEKHYFVEKK